MPNSGRWMTGSRQAPGRAPIRRPRPRPPSLRRARAPSAPMSLPPAPGRGVDVALAEALRRAREPTGRLRLPALHQAGEPGAGGRHRDTDELPLTLIGIAGKPGETVGIARFLALRVLLPVHARERTDTIVRAGCHARSPPRRRPRGRKAAAMLGRTRRPPRWPMQISGIIGDAHPEDAASCYRRWPRSTRGWVAATALSSSTSWPPSSSAPAIPAATSTGSTRAWPSSSRPRATRAAYEHMKKAVSVQQDPAARPTP